MAFSAAINDPYLYSNVQSNSYRTTPSQSQINSTNYSNNPYASTNSASYNQPTNSTQPKLFQSFSSPDDMSNKIVTFDLNKTSGNDYGTYSHTYHTHTATAPHVSLYNSSKTNSGISATTHSKSATTISLKSSSHQSSKSFGKSSSHYNGLDEIETPTHTVNWNELVSPCPSMVMSKCKCKHLLKQNKEAKKLWHSCYRISVGNLNYEIDTREIEIAYFYGLYSKLNEYFQYVVNSQRIPTKYQISESIKRFGAFQISSNNDIVIDRCHFITFWKWYRGICNIIKDCYNLWDYKFQFQLDLFIDRQTCQSILERAPAGTFILRLSQSQYNGLVISYSEPSFNRKICIRHLLLIRHEKDNYITKTNHNSHKATSLNSLIRNFVKLKFVYTPNVIYKKKHVF